MEVCRGEVRGEGGSEESSEALILPRELMLGLTWFFCDLIGQQSPLRANATLSLGDVSDRACRWNWHRVCQRSWHGRQVTFDPRPLPSGPTIVGTGRGTVGT